MKKKRTTSRRNPGRGLEPSRELDFATRMRIARTRGGSLERYERASALRPTSGFDEEIDPLDAAFPAPKARRARGPRVQAFRDDEGTIHPIRNSPGYDASRVKHDRGFHKRKKTVARSNPRRRHRRRTTARRNPRGLSKKTIAKNARFQLEGIRELARESGRQGAFAYNAGSATRYMEAIHKAGEPLPEWAIKDHRFLQAAGWQFPYGTVPTERARRNPKRARRNPMTRKVGRSKKLKRIWRQVEKKEAPKIGKVRAIRAANATIKKIRAARNPSASDYAQAAERFRKFRGRDAKAGEIVTVKNSGTTAFVLGEFNGLLYRVDGRQLKRFHYFSKKRPPLVLVSADGRELFIVQGKFRFTSRGIEG